MHQLLTVLVFVYVFVRIVRKFNTQFHNYCYRSQFYATAYVTHHLSAFISRYLRNSTKDTHSAPWPGDTKISSLWLTDILRSQGYIDDSMYVEKSTLVSPAANTGRGLSGSMLRFELAYSTSSTDTSNNPKAKLPPTSVILKMTPNTIQKRFGSLMASAWREATFYSASSDEKTGLGSGLSVYPFHLPTVYYAYGSSWTGTCVIVMEDLAQKGTGVNMFLGNRNTTPVLQTDKPAPQPVEVLQQLFVQSASLHARYWNDSNLMTSHPWLKGVGWFGNDTKSRTAWELSMATSRQAWAVVRRKHAVDEALSSPPSDPQSSPAAEKIVWSPRLVAVLDRAFAQSSWEGVQNHLRGSVDPQTGQRVHTIASASSMQQPSMNRLPFTLTHGDFHAANMMWTWSGKQQIPTSDSSGSSGSRNVCMVDWAEAGLWEPCTDLGQVMISDVSPTLRRENERRLVRLYWEALVAAGVSSSEFPFSLCWARYQRAGLERFLWLFPLLAQYSPKPLPIKSVQFVHDQIVQFMEDHCVSNVDDSTDHTSRKNELLSLPPVAFAQRMEYRILALIP